MEVLEGKEAALIQLKERKIIHLSIIKENQTPYFRLLLYTPKWNEGFTRDVIRIKKETISEAITEFNTFFETKTNTTWENRHDIVGNSTFTWEELHDAMTAMKERKKLNDDQYSIIQTLRELEEDEESYQFIQTPLEHLLNLFYTPFSLDDSPIPDTPDTAFDEEMQEKLIKLPKEFIRLDTYEKSNETMRRYLLLIYASVHIFLICLRMIIPLPSGYQPLIWVPTAVRFYVEACAIDLKYLVLMLVIAILHPTSNMCLTIGLINLGYVVACMFMQVLFTHFSIYGMMNFFVQIAMAMLMIILSIDLSKKKQS
mmetsp:Transcript_3669/g.5422  ORF Transcript_3669/g.5422 Transcript_3669/m.5422 type:complete len:313 (+) Transcript_3669:29-967(+)